jgi:hypothetical protein
VTLGDKLRKVAALSPKREWKRRPEILLFSGVVQPLHEVCPREILGRKWWDQTRKESYKSTNYHCVACGVHKSVAAYHKWLEGHERYEVDYVRGIQTYLDTQPLCHFCHSYCHLGRLKALLDRGEIYHAKFVDIVQHGDRVLAEAGLTKIVYNGAMAPWSKWRLILFGKKHRPKYRSLKAWEKAHR